MSELMSMFHDVSPYEGHDISAHPADLQGWGSKDPVFRDVLQMLQPKIIVEVGTWKGASAVHMAELAREMSFSTKIICVDTWLGSPEHFRGKQKAWRDSLRLQNGYPRLYFTFLTNVIAHKLTDTIIPLPTTSENGAHILADKQIRPDLVYIDGAHEYAPVLRDLEAYWKLLSDDGVLIGDDYINWPGVTRAANDFAKSMKLPIVGRRGKFVLAKSDAVRAKISLS